MNVSNCPKSCILFTSSFWYSKKYALNDQLTLYDGNSKAAPKIGGYCGPIFPPRSISLTNEVFIWFQSDKYGGTNIGFELKYEPYSKFFIFPWITLPATNDTFSYLNSTIYLMIHPCIVQCLKKQMVQDPLYEGK